MSPSPQPRSGFDAAPAGRHCPAMDRADDSVMGTFEAACICVRPAAIAKNYEIVQRLAGPAAVAGVVKADAYGTGVAQAAGALLGAGCDTFFVARLEEGIALRPLAPEARIFVLDGAQPDMVPALISHNLTPVLNSLGEIAAWSAAAKTTRSLRDAAVHIDTGMNRLGLPAPQLSELAAEQARLLSDLRVVLWMSHLACSDDPAAKMNRVQLDRFRTVLAMLPQGPASLSASGGVMLGKDYHFDMVRPGICLYGGHPQPGAGANPFQPVVKLTARILQVHQAQKGESVGYGATVKLKRSSRLATAALGYADGVLRSLSNVAEVAVQGVRVPLLGRISMDLFTFDVTDVAGPVAAGDEVELFGDTITLDEIAARAGTISYEILTSLSRRATRRIGD